MRRPPREARGGGPGNPRGAQSQRPKKEPRLLFQKQFRSVGPRTYSAQVMEAGNGNQYIVLAEGKPDDQTGELRQTRLFVFSEDFDEFWNLLRDVARFTRDNPIAAEVRAKREAFWKKQSAVGAGAAAPARAR